MKQIKALAAALVVSLAPATVLATAVSGSDPSYAITPDGRFYIVPLGDTGKVQYRKVGAVRAVRVRPVAPATPSAPAPVAATPAKQCTPASEWVPPAPVAAPAAPAATTPVTRVRNRPTVLRTPGQARTTAYTAWTVTGGSQPAAAVAPTQPAASQLPLCPPDQDPSLAKSDPKSDPLGDQTASSGGPGAGGPGTGAPSAGGMGGGSGGTPGSGNPFLEDDLIPSFSSNSSGLPGILGRESVEDGEGGEGGGEGGVNGEQGEVGPSSTEEIFIAAPSLVPEPGSLALLGLGLIGLGAARRRRPA